MEPKGKLGSSALSNMSSHDCDALVRTRLALSMSLSTCKVRAICAKLCWILSIVLASIQKTPQYLDDTSDVVANDHADSARTSRDVFAHNSGRSESRPSLLNRKARIVVGLAERAVWRIGGTNQGTHGLPHVQ